MVDNSGFAAGEAKINLSSSTTALNPLKKGKNYLVTGSTSSVGYRIDVASYNNDVTSITSGSGISVSPDGVYLFILSSSGVISRRTLSTPFDLSTAGSPQSLSLTTGDYGDLHFKNDGTQYYVTRLNLSVSYVEEYTLSTPWDLTTGSKTHTLNVTAQSASTPSSLTLSRDGTKMYHSANSNNIYQYTLSTAWDLSTASYDSISSSFSGGVQSFYINDNGTKLFIIQSADNVRSYSFGTPYQANTLSLDSETFSVNSVETDCRGIAFTDSGEKFFGVSFSTGNVFSYDTELNTLDHYLPSVVSVTDPPVKLYPSGQFLWDNTVLAFTLYGNGNNITVLNLDGSFSTPASSITLDENVPLEMYYDGTNWVVTRE